MSTTRFALVFGVTLLSFALLATKDNPPPEPIVVAQPVPVPYCPQPTMPKVEANPETHT